MATRTARRTIARPRARRGRPRTHREAWTKVSVVMFERQVLELDRLTTAIRSKTGANLTRAEVIRALLDALNESRLDVTSVVSGAQLKRMLAAEAVGLTRGNSVYKYLINHRRYTSPTFPGGHVTNTRLRTALIVAVAAAALRAHACPAARSSSRRTTPA